MYNAASYWEMAKRKRAEQITKNKYAAPIAVTPQRFDAGGMALPSSPTPQTAPAAPSNPSQPQTAGQALLGNNGQTAASLFGDPQNLMNLGKAIQTDSPAEFFGVDNGYHANQIYGQPQLQTEVNDQADIRAGQQQLAGALQNQMYGYGPDPAQAKLQANVDANNGKTAAMISAQRGLNPALAARMGINANANANSNAANEAAQLQQQEALQAEQNLGNLYGQEQQGNLGYQNLYDQTTMGAMGINAKVASENQQANEGIIGGIMGGVGSALQPMKAKGGMISKPKYAEGGDVAPAEAPAPSTGPLRVNFAQPMTINGGQKMDYTSISKPQAAGGPQSELGKYLASKSPTTGAGALYAGFSKLGEGAGQGAKSMMNAAPSAEPESEDSSNPDSSARYEARGGQIRSFKPGGNVPGKAKFKGDNYANDTVQAVLSPKEIVIPRHITMANDAPKKAAAFVAAILAKQKGKRK